jgi:DNA polymerase III subunit gamma/tau
MTFTPWHLEYRPNTLEQIVGKPLIACTLSNLISSGKISGAFLFSGCPRTRKTSIARIIAKSLNCLNSSTPTVNPCDDAYRKNDSITKGKKRKN